MAKVGEDHLPPNSQPSQTHAGVQGHGLRVNFGPSPLELAGYVDTIGDSGNGSQPVVQTMKPLVGTEMEVHARRPAMWDYPLKGAVNDADLFGSGP